jgi:hypothetical protein
MKTVRSMLAAPMPLGDQPPTEFRLFIAGWNSTEKGNYLFDDVAAESVMACYAKWGIDLMIDLEHQSLAVEPGAADPTARDARGWAKLALRPDGALWCTEVRWTPDGIKRLSEKAQRYISPAFESDPKTKRVLKIINVALVALPATHKTPALVAASATQRKGGSVDPKLIKQALEAIESGDAKAASEILKALIAAAAGSPAEGGEPGAEGDGAPGIEAPPEAESVIDPKIVAEGEIDDAEDEDKDEKKKMAKKAMMGMLGRLTDSKSLSEALVKVGEYRQSHLTLETERQQLAAQRATLESAERRQLVVELVKCGAEFPSTAWADDKASKLQSRWLTMPIVELRAHASAQKAARKSAPSPKPGITPPAGDAGTNEHGLTADEMRICLSMKCDPVDFAALKAFRDSKGKK